MKFEQPTNNVFGSTISFSLDLKNISFNDEHKLYFFNKDSNMVYLKNIDTYNKYINTLYSNVVSDIIIYFSKDFKYEGEIPQFCIFSSSNPCLPHQIPLSILGITPNFSYSPEIDTKTFNIGTKITNYQSTDSIVVFGAAISDVNGIYDMRGIYNGKSYYNKIGYLSNPLEYSIYWDDFNLWDMTNSYSEYTNYLNSSYPFEGIWQPSVNVTKQVYNYTPENTGIQIVFPENTTSVTVKLWGAGGSGGNFSGNNGGGGGYTIYTFVPEIGSEYYISVGRKGIYKSYSGGMILKGGGANSTFSGSGADASCLIKYKNGMYILMAVAGGGGGGGTTGVGNGLGGAGGGVIGQPGSGSTSDPPVPNGGSNGIGGYGRKGSGENCIIASSNITGFGGSGATGGFGGSGNYWYGAGGGYGGGGTTTGSGVAGGGGFINTFEPEYV